MEVQKELENLKNELTKYKDDKKIKNKCILAHNTNLIKKLQMEYRSKIILIDELLDSRSVLNRMKTAQRKQLLIEMRSNCVTELEKLAVITEQKTTAMKLAEASMSPQKASFV